MAHRSPRGGPGGCVHAIRGSKGGPKTRQRGPLGAAKACVIANDDGKTGVFLMIFKNNVFRCVFQRRAPGAVGISSKTMVFAPWRSLGAPWEACRRALWVPGGSRNHGLVFFWRQGGPLGAAKVCIIENEDGKTQRLLMILLFALSALGGIPGSSKSESLGPRRAQGPPLNFHNGPMRAQGPLPKS